MNQLMQHLHGTQKIDVQNEMGPLAPLAPLGPQTSGQCGESQLPTGNVILHSTTHPHIPGHQVHGCTGLNLCLMPWVLLFV